MAVLDELWGLERRCWLEGRAFYETIITDGSVYAFPPPMGIFKGADFVQHMGEDGPMVDVEISQQQACDFGDVVVLVYHGWGTGRDGTSRASHCSTVWQRSPDGWKLAAHHQTPVDG